MALAAAAAPGARTAGGDAARAGVLQLGQLVDLCGAAGRVERDSRASQAGCAACGGDRPCRGDCRAADHDGLCGSMAGAAGLPDGGRVRLVDGAGAGGPGFLAAVCVHRGAARIARTGRTQAQTGAGEAESVVWDGLAAGSARGAGMKRRPILAADLFCGAGGTSTGLAMAARILGVDVTLVAVNHWPVAIATHQANHPDHLHKCANLAQVDPCELVPGGYLDALFASPECTHHSIARGGKPRSDQSRSSPMLILDWLSKLHVKAFVIENVIEFQSWGPLDEEGQPISQRKGKPSSHGWRCCGRWA